MPSITCPSCAATYRVPEAALVPGRRLRCARCAHDWALAAEPPVREPPPEIRPQALMDLERPTAQPAQTPRSEPAPSAPPPPEPLPSAAEAMPRHDRPAREAPPPLAEASYPPRPRAGIGLWLAWILTLLALAGGAYALWQWQSGLAEAWPPLQRLGVAPPR